jgi:hypothetical protein
MRTFEVLRRSDNRWLLAGVFDDAAHAIADAKSLMTRARTPEAVRVMAVEQREMSFVEWVIFQETTDDEPIDDPLPTARAEWKPPEEAPPEPPETLPASLPELPPPPRPRRAKTTRPRPPSPRHGSALTRVAVVALIVIALGGFYALLARRGPTPQQVWIFDTPEAQKPHALRNPWTGEISR